MKRCFIRNQKKTNKYTVYIYGLGTQKRYIFIFFLPLFKVTLDNKNSNVDEKKIPDEEDDEENFEDDEETHTPNCFSKFVVKVQRLLQDFFSKNKKWIKIGFIILLTIAYICYFSYAMYYEVN